MHWTGNKIHLLSDALFTLYFFQSEEMLCHRHSFSTDCGKLKEESHHYIRWAHLSNDNLLNWPYFNMSIVWSLLFPYKYRTRRTDAFFISLNIYLSSTNHAKTILSFSLGNGLHTPNQYKVNKNCSCSGVQLVIATELFSNRRLKLDLFSIYWIGLADLNAKQWSFINNSLQPL